MKLLWQITLTWLLSRRWMWRGYICDWRHIHKLMKTTELFIYSSLYICNFDFLKMSVFLYPPPLLLLNPPPILSSLLSIPIYPFYIISIYPTSIPLIPYTILYYTFSLFLYPSGKNENLHYSWFLVSFFGWCVSVFNLPVVGISSSAWVCWGCVDMPKGILDRGARN